MWYRTFLMVRPFQRQCFRYGDNKLLTSELSFSKRFSGLMSRCAMFREWQRLMAREIWNRSSYVQLETDTTIKTLGEDFTLQYLINRFIWAHTSNVNLALRLALQVHSHNANKTNAHKTYAHKTNDKQGTFLQLFSFFIYGKKSIAHSIAWHIRNIMYEIWKIPSSEQSFCSMDWVSFLVVLFSSNSRSRMRCDRWDKKCVQAACTKR